MTPALPMVGHPLAEGGMSSKSAADFVYISYFNGHDHRDHGFHLVNLWL